MFGLRMRDVDLTTAYKSRRDLNFFEPYSLVVLQRGKFSYNMYGIGSIDQPWRLVHFEVRGISHQHSIHRDVKTMSRPSSRATQSAINTSVGHPKGLKARSVSAHAKP
jgi:hypothetical protein